jgi:multiple sugar transport system substrate-binding protein
MSIDQPNQSAWRAGGRLSRRAFGAGAMASLTSAGAFPAPALAQNAPVTVIWAEGNPNFDVLEAIAAEFTAATGTPVSLNNMDHEAHKIAIRNYLVAGPPEITFWFAGERTRAFAARGLFSDLSDLYDREGYAGIIGPYAESVSFEDRPYGLPLGVTLWGLFYRRDVLGPGGIPLPATWDELLSYGEAARAAGLDPISMGSKELWPVHTLMTNISLRTLPLDKHLGLYRGQVAWTDPDVARVFDNLGELSRRNFFTPNHTSFDWLEAGVFLANKEAGMLHTGAFIRDAFRPEERDQLAFTAFPVFDPGVGRSEETTINSIHICANAPNQDGARDFLAFFYAPEQLGRYIAPSGALLPRNDMAQPTDPISAQMVESLATVVGTSLNFDLEANPDMTTAALPLFQEFLVNPDRQADILDRLEAARARIYG